MKQECQTKEYLRERLSRLINGNDSKEQKVKGLNALHSLGVIDTKQLAMYLKVVGPVRRKTLRRIQKW
jgi:molybdopterin synthase catalytic subunit